jgi:type II secretory pathway component PulF
VERLGLTALSVTPLGAMAPRRVPRQDVAIVLRSIAELLHAGVPLDRAVRATRPVATPRVQPAIDELLRLLAAGRPFADALGVAEGLGGPDIVAMVRAGERAGRLGDALDRIASQLERELELLGIVRQALAYPAVLAVAGTASIAVIATIVVPRFAALLSDAGQSLPPATAALIGVTAAFRRFGVPLAAASVALVAIGVRVVRQPSGRLAWHRLLLRVPILGPLRHGLASARALQALATALGAGVPLAPALTLVRDATGDAAIAERIARARERVLGGSPLASALQGEEAIHPSALQLLAVGEASGQLGVMAERGSRLVRADAERRLRTAAGMIEPLLILVFGGLISLVAAALLQAVYSLRPGG